MNFMDWQISLTAAGQFSVSCFVNGQVRGWTFPTIDEALGYIRKKYTNQGTLPEMYDQSASLREILESIEKRLSAVEEKS